MICCRIQNIYRQNVSFALYWLSQMANQSPPDDDLLAALQHPLRRRILQAMAGKRPISPRELADQRGATQHFYRWAIEAAWARKMLAESKEKSEDERS